MAASQCEASFLKSLLTNTVLDMEIIEVTRPHMVCWLIMLDLGIQLQTSDWPYMYAEHSL